MIIWSHNLTTRLAKHGWMVTNKINQPLSSRGAEKARRLEKRIQNMT